MTDLYSRPFPLIRYRMGDRVIFGVEKGIPVLRELAGRESHSSGPGDGLVVEAPSSR